MPPSKCWDISITWTTHFFLRQGGIALCGGTIMEEVLDLSSDRLLNEMKLESCSWYSDLLQARQSRVESWKEPWIFSSPRTVWTGSGAHPPSYSMGTGVLSQRQSSWGVRQTPELHLVLTLGMSGAIYLFPLHVFTVWTGTILPFSALSATTKIMTASQTPLILPLPHHQPMLLTLRT